MFEKNDKNMAEGGPISEKSNYRQLAEIRKLSLVQYQEFYQYVNTQCLVLVSKIAQSMRPNWFTF